MFTVLLREIWNLIIGTLSDLKMGPVSRLAAVLASYALLILSPVVNPRAVLELFRDAFDAWNADKASRLAAGLAFYAVFALAPVLIIVIAITGLVFEVDTVRDQLVGQVRDTIGNEGATAIETTIENILQPRSGRAAIVIGVVTVVFGGIGVVGHLQTSLNIIWHVESEMTEPLPIEKTLEDHVRRSWLLRAHVVQTVLIAFVKALVQWLRRTFLSFFIVLVSGFLLIAFMVARTLATVLNEYLSEVGSTVGLFDFGPVGQLMDTFISVAVIALLFAVIYRVLPDMRIPWGDVWVGAATTAVLFLIGQFLIGRYLAESGVESIYGAAGALVILLLWIYYTAQIFLFGAELAKVYAHKHGSLRGTQAASAAGGRGIC